MEQLGEEIDWGDEIKVEETPNNGSEGRIVKFWKNCGGD